MSYYPMGGSGGAGGQSNLPRLYPPLAQPVRSGGMQDGSGGGAGGFYPQVAQPVGIQPMRAPPSPAVASGGGGGIRVRIKPEYRMAPGVELSPLDGVIPRSAFHFDFALEREVLEDNDQDNPFRPPQPPSVQNPALEAFPKEAVQQAISVYSDDEEKVMEFCTNYSKMTEMGFVPESITASLAMYDNDVRRAINHLTHGNGS